MRRSTALMAAAAALLLLVSSLAVASQEVEVETRRMFRAWMAKMGKSYPSIDEEEHRYAVFKENHRRHLGLNGFADLTDEELRSIYNGCVLEPSLIDELINTLRWGLGFRA